MVSRQGHAVVKVFWKAGDGLSIIASALLYVSRNLMHKKRGLKMRKGFSGNKHGRERLYSFDVEACLLRQERIKIPDGSLKASSSFHPRLKCECTYVYTAFAKNCGLVREQPLSSTNFFTTLDNCTNYEIEASRAYLHLAVSNWTQRTNCPPATIATEILIRLVKVLSVAQSSSLS